MGDDTDGPGVLPRAGAKKTQVPHTRLSGACAGPRRRRPTQRRHTRRVRPCTGRGRPSPHLPTPGVTAAGPAAPAILGCHDRQGWPLSALTPASSPPPSRVALLPRGTWHRQPIHQEHKPAARRQRRPYHPLVTALTAPPAHPPPFTPGIRYRAAETGNDCSPKDCQSHRQRERSESRDLSSAQAIHTAYRSPLSASSAVREKCERRGRGQGRAGSPRHPRWSWCGRGRADAGHRGGFERELPILLTT